MLRRSLAVALLCVHAVAAVHLAFAEHVTGDAGAVVDAAPVCPQPGHGSAGIAHGHDLQRHGTECQAAAWLRAVARAQASLAVVAVAAVVAPDTVAPADARPPVGVLSVAPKSSPPV